MAQNDRHALERYPRDAAYLDRVHGRVGPMLAEVEAAAAREGQPITERATARLLAFAVRASGARRALEIGTNIGYSALWIADALPEDGHLTCFDVSRDLLRRAESHLARAGLGHKVSTVLGPALTTLDTVPGLFDFAYIDADEMEYAQYLAKVVERLRPGGVVAVDNLLWHGQTAHEPEDRAFARQTTPAIRFFNDLLLSHPGLHATIVQVGAGVGLGVKC